MGVVPDDRVGKIEFYENHTTPWSTNAVAIGTTATAVTDLTTKTTAARTSYNAQQAAQSVAKAATLTFNQAVDAMATAGSDIIKQIRAKAATAGDSVYALAQIPAPATPSPKPAPGMPFGFAAELGADGAVTLTWKCNNPTGTSGTIYQVYRRIGPAAGGPAAGRPAVGNSAIGNGEFSYLGGSGTKDFVDDTIPAGSSQVTYQFQAVRSTAVGPWAQFNVSFGVSGGGAAATIASVEETAVRKAA